MFMHASLPLALLDDLVLAMMGGGKAGGVGSICSSSSRSTESREIVRETLTAVSQIVQLTIVSTALGERGCKESLGVPSLSDADRRKKRYPIAAHRDRSSESSSSESLRVFPCTSRAPERDESLSSGMSPLTSRGDWVGRCNADPESTSVEDHGDRDAE